MFKLDNSDELKQKEEVRKQKEQKEKCDQLETVYAAFQSYMTCLETTPNEIFESASRIELVKKDTTDIEVACVEAYNQNYQIPENMRSELNYFFELHEKLKEPPPNPLGSSLGEMMLLPFMLFKTILEKEEDLMVNKEEDICFEDKVSSYSFSITGGSFYENLPQQEKEKADNQIRIASEIFFEQCRKQTGEKAYQDIKQELECDLP